MLSRRAATRRRTAAKITRGTVDCAAAVATRETAAADETRSGRAAAAVFFRPTSASGKAGEDRCDRSIQQCQARRSPLRPRAPAPAAPTPEHKRTVLRRKSRAREIFPDAKNRPVQKREVANRVVCGSLQNSIRQYRAGPA